MAKLAMEGRLIIDALAMGEALKVDMKKSEVERNGETFLPVKFLATERAYRKNHGKVMNRVVRAFTVDVSVYQTMSILSDIVDSFGGAEKVAAIVKDHEDKLAIAAKAREVKKARKLAEKLLAERVPQA